jgi:hypothetical protein
MPPIEQKKIIPNHDGVSDCRRINSTERTFVSCEDFTDEDVSTFLIENKAKVIQSCSIYDPAPTQLYEIEIEKDGKKYYTSFIHNPKTEESGIRIFDKQIRIACAILLWEMSND